MKTWVNATTGYMLYYDPIGKRDKPYHRYVWEQANVPIPDGMLIDHINGDVLDNRLDNLRLVTFTQNMWNRKKPATNTSGIKGVSWNNKRGQWLGRVCKNGKTYFKWGTLLECAGFVISCRAELHGEYARNA